MDSGAGPHTSEKINSKGAVDMLKDLGYVN
jgi:hypothetical protein